MSNITVRRATLQDLDRLEKFYYQAYGPRAKYKYPERWHWLFRDAPQKAESILHVYIAENQSGEIIGHSAASRVRAKMFNKSYILGWSIDSIVLPELRGQGIGKLLQKINRDDHPLFASLFMSEANKHIKIKQGAIESGVARTYIKGLRFGWSPGDFLVRLAQVVKMNKTSRFEGNISNRAPAQFDNFDSQLWESVKGDYTFAVERDADYLNWRYQKQPWTRHFCYRSYDIQGNLKGILVYRVTEESSHKAAVVTELFGDRTMPEIFTALLKKLEKDLEKEPVFQIQIAISDPVIEKEVRDLKYITTAQNTLMISGGEEIESLKSIESTFMLSKGDQDWDQFPLGNVHYLSMKEILTKIFEVLFLKSS